MQGRALRRYQSVARARRSRRQMRQHDDGSKRFETHIILSCFTHDSTTSLDPWAPATAARSRYGMDVEALVKRICHCAESEPDDGLASAYSAKASLFTKSKFVAPDCFVRRWAAGRKPTTQSGAVPARQEYTSERKVKPLLVA
jgi:hypothetical protein